MLPRQIDPSVFFYEIGLFHMVLFRNGFTTTNCVEMKMAL